MAKKIGWIALSLMLAACSSMPLPTPSPPAKYELLLSGSIDNIPFQGIGMGSSSASHAVTVQSSIAVNYFTVESCHRAQQFNDVITEPWYTWFTGTNVQGFNWTYTAMPGLEDTGDCPLRFCAFSNTVGSPPVACAVIDFHANKYALPSTNICNGEAAQNTGSSMCHTMMGLTERIQFPGPVVTAPPVIDPTGKNAPYWIPGQCVGEFVDQAQSLWQYQMPQTECTIIFMEKAPPYRRAKLLVIPYNQALYGGT
jgi:hypothetical protein